MGRFCRCWRLRAGNAADPSKSDTWHYVRQHLDGTAGDHISDQRLMQIGQRICHNVFALITPCDRIELINRHQGVEIEGVFFSNTYA